MCRMCNSHHWIHLKYRMIDLTMYHNRKQDMAFQSTTAALQVLCTLSSIFNMLLSK